MQNTKKFEKLMNEMNEMKTNMDKLKAQENACKTIDSSILNIPKGITLRESQDYVTGATTYDIYDNKNNFRRTFKVPIGGISRAQAEFTLQKILSEYKNGLYLEDVMGDIKLPINKDVCIPRMIYNSVEIEKIVDNINNNIIEAHISDNYESNSDKKYVKQVMHVSEAINKIEKKEKKSWFKK